MNFIKSRSRSRRNSTNYILENEKWRPRKRMSRRDQGDSEEDSDDEDTVKEPLNWEEEFFGRTSVGDVDQDVDVRLTKKQTLILSTLLPDEILLMDKFDNVEPKRFVGVLLMADVSGYTALSERYNATGKGGTYRLTVTLNTYLGALIEIIYSHGGDILKFAGDAFLALWKTDKHTYIYHTIHNVITCALIIQHSYARYETDVKVNLRVKLAISAGNLVFSPIGAGIDMNYVVFGLPVIEAKLAESLCASGEVKVTPSAWAHCFTRNYDYIIEDNGHVTIKSILYDPREKDVTKPFLGFGNIVKQIKKTYNHIESLPEALWDAEENLTSQDALKRNEALKLRNTITIAEKRNIGSDIRNFIIRPVLTQIDAHQPLEYLTEMRQVSVVFLTLKPKECAPAHLITIVNNSYQITCDIVYKSMGCVNKIILFDKDVMALVIFGLRGFKHESEAQAALKCAYNIKKAVSALDGVLEVSIGVTTGQVYCGVIGHPLRREFTVIGAIVNKAARLMCSFRNKITCDEVTFAKSKMSKNGFTLQPRTELKGIVQPGKIYEYTEDIRLTAFNDIPMITPLLDRVEEMEYFQSWINAKYVTCRDYDVLMLIGESRIGKSRLLEWMARSARFQDYKVCYLSLTSIHTANLYLTMSQIINQMLELEEPINGFDKEEKIVDLLKYYDDDLCYLNNVLKVRFAFHEGIYTMSEEQRKQKAIIIFEKFIKLIPEKVIICLDDLQNLDSGSWEFIYIMTRSVNIFTVLTITRGKFGDTHCWLYDIFINNTIKQINLGPLAAVWIPPLACQILNVDAVPSDLCNTLRTKCKGMPGLVESFILHLFSTGAIEVNKVSEDELNELKNEDLQFPESSLLHPQALNAIDQDLLKEVLAENIAEGAKICIVTEKDELNANLNTQNKDALLMVQIDALTPYQQLLLKIASVIGHVLSRDLLENIMYDNNPLTTAKAIKRIFSMRILSCANAVSGSNRKNKKSFVGMPKDADLLCDCRFEYDPENSDNLPKYAFCKVMKFRNKNSRKICYELLPMNQKKEFHSRIVNYLENNKQKCSDCGGALMIVQSSLILNDDAKRDELNLDFFKLRELSSSSSHSADPDVENDRKLSMSVLQDADTMNKFSADLMRTFSERLNVAKFDNMVSDYSKSTPLLQTKHPEEEDSDSLRDSENISSENNIFEKVREVMEADHIDDWTALGIVDSTDDIQNQVKENCFCLKLEKGVSQINFDKCTCAELNIRIYEQLIHHSKQAEMTKKVLEFIIHYCYLNLQSDNIDVTLEGLVEAEEWCAEKLLKENLLTSFERRRYFGQIYSLKAAAFLLSGRLLASKIEIEKAGRMYGINLLKMKEVFHIKKIIHRIVLKSKEYRIKQNSLMSESLFCTNTATLLFSSLGDKLARACAFRALDAVQKYESNVTDVCDALTNILQIEIDRGYADGTNDIEQINRNTIKCFTREIKSEELYAVGKLFMASFRARMARANLPGAIYSGYRAVILTRFLHAKHISLAIIPDLFYALVCRCRIKESIDLLSLVLTLEDNQESYSCKTWYYALCMDLILEAGIQLEAPHEINRFAEYSLNVNKGDGPGKRRLITNLWTYWLRADSERRAKRYENDVLKWAGRDPDDVNLTSILTSLRLADGMLESLAKKVDDLRKVVDMMELRSIAERELGRLEKDCRDIRILHPYWLLLKAKCLNLSGRLTIAVTTYNHAMEEAKRMNNRLLEASAKAALSNPVTWAQNARIGCFLNWRDGQRIAKISWDEIIYKTIISK